MATYTTLTQNANLAFEQYMHSSNELRAAFLESIAQEIEALGEALLAIANQETNLPITRLEGERARTCFQLRMFAEKLRAGNYVDATIDKSIRYLLQPIGPVVVFGASNFPFAYSTAGGDTASALAAGCSVIVKAHPAHLQTSSMVASAIQKAIATHQLPTAVFQHIVDTDYEAGKALVQDENIAAVGFTGSRQGGRALLDYANARKNPIPVFSEMGSVNPVVILEGALKENGMNIAQQYAASITLGVGQFCTNPGILIGVKSEALQVFAEALSAEMSNIDPPAMLHAGIQAAYEKNASLVLSQKGIQQFTKQSPTKEKAYPVLAKVSGHHFMENTILAEEVFGPYSLLIECENLIELERVWKSLKGQITTTIMATEQELKEHTQMLQSAILLAGRVVINGVPTGVEVCDSMVHGGPYPATTDSRFTAVGAKAIYRWLRPVAYQGWPDSLLPLALQNNNPLQIWRTINGQLTKEAC